MLNGIGKPRPSSNFNLGGTNRYSVNESLELPNSRNYVKNLVELLTHLKLYQFFKSSLKLPENTN